MTYRGGFVASGVILAGERRQDMPELSTEQRDRLRDNDFAYIA